VSIKDEIKVGQTWKSDSELSWKVTGFGEDSLICKGVEDDGEFGDESLMPYWRCEVHRWTLTHDSGGNAINSLVGEIRKVEIDWRHSRSVEDFVDSAPGFGVNTLGFINDDQ